MHDDPTFEYAALQDDVGKAFGERTTRLLMDELAGSIPRQPTADTARVTDRADELAESVVMGVRAAARNRRHAVVSELKGLRSETGGWVYLLQDSEDLEVVKIGWSSNVYGRMQKLQTGYPRRLRLVGVIREEGKPRLENKLHSFFREQRMSGEWFRLSAEDISAVMTARPDVTTYVGEYVPTQYNDEPSGASNRRRDHFF